jgi:hypothetical protein
MIEEKLQSAANALPENFNDFSAVENRIADKANRSMPLRRRRLVIAMVLAILLVGCVAVTEPDYHLYNGNWWQFLPGLYEDPAKTFDLHWEQTQKATDKLGITLPETLGGYPVISYNRFNLTTKKVPIQIAWLSPKYVYHSSYYGMEKAESYISPEGIEGTRHWREGSSILYGSTDDEIWRRQFGFDENNVFTASNHTDSWLQLDKITALAYMDFTLYVCKITSEELEFTNWKVTWVDDNNGVVFSIDSQWEDSDALTEYAKQIIDLNK